jgi:hypothetical protein
MMTRTTRVELDEMAAHPETLLTIQTVHDTLRVVVRDTVLQPYLASSARLDMQGTPACLSA